MLETTSTKAARPTARKSAGATGATKTATTAGKGAAGGAKGVDLQAQIRQRAYELWEREGRPEGCDHAHWQQAEREIVAARART
jgi:hypothetical protein